jgi:ParB family chromosome partitioning protein
VRTKTAGKIAAAQKKNMPKAKKNGVGAQEQGVPTSGYVKISAECLQASAYQPRQHFDDALLEELAASIRVHGVLQPLVVRQSGAQQYEIIAGERRFRAAKRAGLTEIPCVISDVADSQVLSLALVENLQREDLNPIEEAEGFRRLCSDLGFTQERVAEAVGRDRTTITNTLRLLRLPVVVQTQLMEKQLSMGHARALLALEDAAKIERLAKQVIDAGLSVRRVEEIVKDDLEKTSETAALPPRRLKKESLEEREIRRRLEGFFHSRVELRHKNGAGKIVVSFASPAELEAILEKLKIQL